MLAQERFTGSTDELMDVLLQALLTRDRAKELVEFLDLKPSKDADLPAFVRARVDAGDAVLTRPKAVIAAALIGEVEGHWNEKPGENLIERSASLFKVDASKIMKAAARQAQAEFRAKMAKALARAKQPKKAKKRGAK